MRTFLGDRNRGTSGTVRATGMRRISPRDTTNLLKSVNAINKNLVSINKLLQNQNKQEVKQQRDQQQEKLRQAENLNKRAAEDDIERSGVKGVSDTLKRSLTEPAKKIRMGLMSFITPFLKFFTVVFIGWFSKGIIGWFKQNKEEKKKQIKDAIPKIVSFITIAGGVLLAINLGIPVITGLIGTMVTLATTAIAALLNPMTFYGILGAAAAGLGIEVYSGLVDVASGGSLKAGSRVRSSLEEDSKRADFGKFIGGLEPTASRTVGVGQSKETKKDLVKFGDSYFTQRDLQKLQEYQGDRTGSGALELQSFDEKGMKSKMVTFSLEQLKNNKKMLEGIPAEVRGQLMNIFQVNQISDLYGKLYSAKKSLADATQKLKDTKETPMTYAGGGGSGSIQALTPAEAEALKTKAQNEYNEAKANLKAAYDATSPLIKKILKDDYNITASQLESEFLAGSEIKYQLGRGRRYFMRQMGDVMSPITDGFDIINKKIAGFTESLATMVSEFEINLNIQPVATEQTDDNAYVPTGGQGIDPFDMENSFIPFAKKTYIILGVA